MFVDGWEDLIAFEDRGGRLDLGEVYLDNLDRDGGLFFPGFGVMRLGANKRFIGAPVVALPACRPCPTSLGDALRERRSTREFTDRPLALQDLSDLLGLSMGVTGDVLDRDVRRRAHPSGGGLFPIEPYLLVESVEGLRPGVYHYSPVLHQLETIRTG